MLWRFGTNNGKMNIVLFYHDIQQDSPQFGHLRYQLLIKSHCQNMLILKGTWLTGDSLYGIKFRPSPRVCHDAGDAGHRGDIDAQ